MAKTKLKSSRRAVRSDIYSDLNKIKAAVADATSSRWNVIQDKTTDFESNVVDYITAQPVKSISYAVLAGVFLGLYMRSK